MAEGARRLAGFVADVFTCGLYREQGIEDTRRYVMTNIVLLMGILALTGFGGSLLAQGDYLLGAVEAAGALLLVAAAVFMRVTRKHEFVSVVSTVVIGALVAYVFTTGGVGGTGHLWSYVFPGTVFFQLRARRGLVAMAAWYGFILTFLFSGAFVVPKAYDANFVVRYLASYSIVAVVAYLAEVVRARTEERLREQSDISRSSEQRLSDIVLSSSDWVWEVDREGRYTYASGRVYDVLGYTVAELMGRTPYELMAEDDAHAARDVLASAVAGKKPIENFVNWNLRKDGRRVCLLTNGVPVLDCHGEVVGFRGVDKDITAERLAEKERAELQEEVRQTQASKMEAIGQLAGGVAHDFNNMLNGIVGFAELLRLKSPEDSESSEYARSIVEMSERASQLTGKLLAFSRKGTFEMGPVDMHETLGEAVAILERTIDRRIAITQRLGASPSTVLGDAAQLQNVILNLGVNARDAMPGGGELTFATENCSVDEGFIEAHGTRIEPGEYLVLTVTDTGTGMDEETLVHVFEPFYSTKGRGEGAGLGLASVYGTVRGHSGAVEVSSTKGRGTTFSVYLPLTSSAAAPTSVKATEAVRGSGHVLFIDDEEMVRRSVSAMLRELGYTVTVCTNGKEGVERYREDGDSFDLVLLDLVMPVMDGHDCLLELKRMDPDVRVVVASGYSLDENARRTIDEGAMAFVQKPFNAAHLSQVIRGVLRGMQVDG